MSPMPVLTPITVLPPGTTTFTLVGLSASVVYTAVVAHQEPPPSTGFTAPQQVTFTSSASVGTVAAPDDPVPFVIPFPPSHGGLPVCGIACFNNEPVPGTSIVFQMATETGVGSGTFGSWGTIDTIPANPFTWVIKTITLPQDGLRREFQMQATRPGCNPSSFTPAVFLNPTTALSPADYPVALPAITFSAADVVLPSGMTVALLATYTPPGDHDFDHMEYEVQTWNGSSWSAAQLVVGSDQGSDVIVASATPGGLYLVTPVTVSTGEPTVQVALGATIQVTRNSGTPTVVPAPQLSNAPIPTLQGVNLTTATYTLPFDVGTAYYMVYAVLYTSSPSPVPDSVEAPNNTIGSSTFGLTPQIYPPKGGGNVTLAIGGLTSSNQYIVVTFVPYNNAGVRGTAVTIGPTQRSATSTPSAPSLSFATFSGTGGTNGGTGPNGGNWNFPGWVGIKVSFNSTPSVGDTVTLYRSGTQVGQHTVATGEPGAGFCTIVDETFTAAGTQIYTAKQTGTVSGGGTSAASSNFSVTLGSAYKLSGPTVALTGGGAYRANMFVTGTMPSDGELPPEGGLTILYAYTALPGGYSGPWTTLTTNGVSGTAYTIAPLPSNYTVVNVSATCAGYTTSTAAQTDKLNPGF